MHSTTCGAHSHVHRFICTCTHEHETQFYALHSIGLTEHQMVTGTKQCIKKIEKVEHVEFYTHTYTTHTDTHMYVINNLLTKEDYSSVFAVVG